jgi:Family of unknown function (DUF6411)
VTAAPPGYREAMVIGGVIALCIILLVLAFLFPRLSRHPERGSERAAGMGGRVAGKAPGPLGRWLRKPFATSQRAMSKSASTGRRGRSKMPF